MVTYGGMSRQPLTVPASALIFNDIKLVGFWVTRWNQMHNAESRSEMINNLAQRFIKGTLKPPETNLIPLSNYKEALENSMKGFQEKKQILIFE
jgi:trans-2-enoyl-CoA reductase